MKRLTKLVCALAVMAVVRSVHSYAPILLKSGTINPEAGVTVATAQAKTTANAQSDVFVLERSLYLVQCPEMVSAEWYKALESTGAKIRSYIPENAYIVDATADAYRKIAAKVPHSYLGEFKPEYRIDESVLQGIAEVSTTATGTRLRTAGDSTNTVETKTYDILLFEASDLAAVSERILKLGGCEVLPSVGAIIRAKLTTDIVLEIASWVEVHWIEPYVEPTVNNNVAVQAPRMNVQTVWPNGASNLGLTGAGQVVAVADTGLDTGNLSTIHEDVRGRILKAYALAPLGHSRFGDWSDPAGHGTHVAGSVLGNGAMSDESIKGTAYEAKLIFQSAYSSTNSAVGCLPTDKAELFRQTYTNQNGNVGARIHSDSWGAKQAGKYTSNSVSVDRFMFEHPDFLAVFSAGNEGVDANEDGIVDSTSIGAPGTAKNCLTVGASENYRTSGGLSTYKWGQAWPTDFPSSPIYEDYISRPGEGNYQGIAAFSSRGPCNDNRVKPDIVAPGTDILSVRSSKANKGFWGNYNSYYAYMGGTSMSTPLVSGSAALIRQWLQEYKNISNPDGATIKAVLLAGAKSLTPGQYGTGQYREIPAAYPNNVEGWGQANVGNAVANTNGVVVHDAQIIANGEAQTFTFTAQAGSALSIVMAYTDAPGSSSSSKALVNNLDLLVTTPSGMTIYPNSQNSPDSVNNVEGVRIASAEAGVYTATVTATSITTGMASDLVDGRSLATRYSLVANGATATPTVTGPANDNFANATRISGAFGSTTGSNIGATYETGEPLKNYKSAATNTIWWVWTAPSSGTATFCTTNTTFDTVMGVYTGSSVSGLTTIKQDDDGGPNNTSVCTFDVVSGTTYYIVVSGYDASKQGTIKLYWNVTYLATIYTITYLPGSYASGSTYTATKTNDVTLVLRGSTYTRTGYTQTGWSTSSDGTSKSYNLSASYTANSAITLYPYWTPNTYSVTYALNGGTHGTTHPSTATYDTAFCISAPTKSGYAFTGWTVTSGLNTSTAKWGTTSSPSTSLTSSTTKCVNGATGNVYFKNLCSTSGNVTLTANWSENVVALPTALDNTTLSFTSGGSSSWFGQTTITHDGVDAARSGALGNNQTNWLQTTVSGPGTISFWWHVSSEQNYDFLEFLIDGGVVASMSGTNNVWTSKSFAISTSGTHTLQWRYRKDFSQYRGLDAGFVDQVTWTPNYTVTYQPGSYASGSTYTATKTNDVALVLRGSTYTRTGYTQTGWSTSSASTSKSYNLSAPYTANSAITLYPYWTPNTYSVTYALNGGTHGTTHPSTATYDTAFYISAPTKSGYAFTGWTVTSGLNTSTAKWGTTSSPSTSLTSSTTKCVNGATGNVYFKNLCPTSGNVTLTANWQCNHASTTVQNARAATCTEAGYTGDTVCNTCGATIATGSTVPALGHQEGAGVVTKEPTATEEGVMTYSCTRCGIVMRMEAIPKIAPPEEVTAPLIHINGSEAIVTAGEFTGESCEVSITCATEGVTIYYTTNGTTPRQIDRHMYTGPFTVTETVTIKAVAVFGEKQSEYMIVTITKRTLTLGEAASADVVGAALTWTTGGDAGWIPIIDSTSATGLSVQSGAIGDATGAELSRTWLQTEVTGNGTFSFRWKVNCEWDDSGESTWDRVMFFTNGVEVARMDGTSEWEELSFSFADSGTHTLRWEFVKDDYNDEEFRDRAWVSEFMWIPGGRIATLPEDATTEAVNAAVEGYEFADSDVERMINGDVHTFNDFALWSQGVAGGRDAVVASKYAVVSYLLRAERAFAEEPIIELGIDEAGQDGALALAVSIRDDVGMVAVSSEKVAEMFEATEDLQDWIGGRLELKVDDMTEGMSGLVRVNVRFGESLPARAFIRLRVKARISSITPPSDVEVSRTATGVMSISWDAVESATGYEVWRAKDEPIISNARMIAVVDDKTSYNDDDVEIGTMYYYWLRTMTGIGYSDFGDHIQGYAIPTFNVEFNANGGSGTMETMSVELGVQTNIVPNVFTRGGYAFAGWATNVVGEVVYGNGARIVPEEDMTLYAVWLDRPWSVSASDATSATAVDLTWAGVAHATSYQIWRGMSRSSSEATLIRSGVTGTSFSDTTVPVGTNYYYWVKAVCGTVTSEFSGYDVGRRMISAPQEVTVTTGSSMTDIVVKWSAGVAGAVRYEIWRAAYTQTSGGAITTVSAYSRIASINSTTLLNGKIRRNVTSYTDQPAFSGNIFYRYYVKAVSGTDTSAASNFSEVRTYQNIGTYSINLPKNGDYAVKMIGGGGGGAMCANSTLNGNVQAGGGSGAGFMGVLTLPSGSYTVSVGAGGFGVNYGTFAVVCNGASGGTTALNKGSSVIVSAVGGGGGSVNPYGFATGGPGGVLTTSRATVVSYTLMANGNVGGGLINAYASGGAALYQSYGRGGDATASGNVGFFQIIINE